MADDAANDEQICDGIIIRSGDRLRAMRKRERIAATHLISGLNFHESVDGWPMSPM